MTRREIERVAAAVKALGKGQDAPTPARISLEIGRAVLGTGSVEAWKKWLTATGWPASIILEMAESEFKAGKRREAGL